MFGILSRLKKISKTIRGSLYSKEFEIIQRPETYFPILYHIKDETWEEVYLAATYQLVEESTIKCFHGRQDILNIKNALITDNSDIVIVGNKILWDKALQTNFTKIIPLDSNLVKYSQNTASIILSNKEEKIPGYCISLLGVHGKIWSHFIIQFLPKLYVAEEAGLLEKPIILLIPDYHDNQISQLVNMVVQHHPQIIIKIAQPRIDYYCEQLIYIPSTVYLGNHADYIITSDCIIPKYVKFLLKEKLILPLANKVKEKPAKHTKLYLVRRNTYRAIKNWPEIETFFLQRGFILVEAHKLTLEEKVHLFYHAQYIAGPLSAAWSNIMFTNGAKGLIMCNFPRCIEPYASELGKIGKTKLLQLTDWDSSANIHSNYKISIQRLEKVYNQWINE